MFLMITIMEGYIIWNKYSGTLLRIYQNLKKWYEIPPELRKLNPPNRGKCRVGFWGFWTIIFSH